MHAKEYTHKQAHNPIVPTNIRADKYMHIQVHIDECTRTHAQTADAHPHDSHVHICKCLYRPSHTHTRT